MSSFIKNTVSRGVKYGGDGLGTVFVMSNKKKLTKSRAQFTGEIWTPSGGSETESDDK